VTVAVVAVPPTATTGLGPANSNWRRNRWMGRVVPPWYAWPRGLQTR